MKSCTLKNGLRTSVHVGCITLVMNFASFAYATSLNDVLISTYNSNPQLLAERARVREIDETYVQARAQGRLTSSISADTGFLDSETTQPGFLGNASKMSSSLKPHSAEIQFIQPIYQGGRVSALKDQAKAGIFSARENLRNVEQNVFLAAATAYSDVLRDEKIAQLRRRNVRVLDKQVVASSERFRLGDGTKTDISQSESRVAGAEIGLAQADARLASSRALFIEAIGYPPEDLTSVPGFLLPTSLDEAVRLARNNNPQIIAAMFNEQAGASAIKAAKAAYRPTVSVNGSYGVSEEQSSNLIESKSGRIVAQLRIPIFTGGLTGSRVRSAEHAKTRLELETKRAERALNRQVSQIWGQLDAIKRSIVSAQTQVNAARSALEGVELEKTVGTRTTLDVLDAEEELLNAQIALAQLQRNLDVISFQFLVVLGAFDAESLQLKIDYYDPAKNFYAVKFAGREQLVDRFVPEAVQKIGVQLPNIPKDVVDLVAASGIPDTLKKDIQEIAKPPSNLANTTKELIDEITLHEPVYGPRPDPE